MVLWEEERDLGRRLAVALLWALLLAAALLAGAPALAQDEWVRDAEPVEVTGELLGEHLGAPLDELGVYVYVDQTWSPIPFQIDEVDSTGMYTRTEDGILDDNDVLVFMARDVGEQAGREWIDNADPVHNARIEIHVVDSVNPGAAGWAYLYRLSDPDLSPDDYVNWNGEVDRVEAISYTLGFSPALHAGIEYLAFDGHDVDVLDRTKIRAEVTCLVFGFPVGSETLTEENLGGLLDPTPRIDGPVRVGGGDTDGVWWYYGGLYETSLTLDVDAIEPPDPCTSLEVSSIRLSTDWQDPAATGMSTTVYYDGNTAEGVTVDGLADGVPETPVSWWKQVSGDYGSLIVVAQAEMESGTPLNYYVDDATEDPEDTGDGQRFGDAGFLVLDPTGAAVVETKAFVLGPNRPNVGETYAEYGATPLEVSATGQRPLLSTYLPVILRDLP
jgi:hypothetical protein